MAIAVTYRTGNCAGKLRTVLLDDARTSVVLLPAGSMKIMTGKLICGTTCRTEFWHEVLGTSGNEFAVPSSQVMAQREMRVAVIARHNHE